jgi:predicted enzyme related to lactoylglutathione lyase
MKLASIRLLTSRLDELVEFYELVTGEAFQRPNPVFAELVTDAGTLAIGGDATLPLFPGTGLTVAANTSAILEFQVDDVDQERERLRDQVQVLQEPTTMPWGNRAMMLVDPDGNRVNLYTPYTDEAKARFAGRAGHRR